MPAACEQGLRKEARRHYGQAVIESGQWCFACSRHMAATPTMFDHCVHNQQCQAKMMEWVPVFLLTIKCIVLGTGMFFSIKWHYDQDQKKKKEAEAAKLRADQAADVTD
ncbi:hypothetical protein GTZ99_08895 [Novosphingobium sp. FSY-8]|uniref:Uncharacterized protein n=1 Tax=Novosphingobium ovatum TaxID=1908523 RepID=A0ABW9XDQ6_9SPHN|nr:hypothetical protein [Novosphingobium ovatum]NBC36674.1 hypothetical protein [Novosphingobium ovatum]